MYSNIRRNVIRAVKVLPEAVRVGAVEVEPTNEENTHEDGKSESELDLAQKRISFLENESRLLSNRIEEAAKTYDEFSARCEKLEHELKNREAELQYEMQQKLESERMIVIDKAKIDASNILMEATKTRSEAFEKGHSEGLLKGQKDGLEKARIDMEAEYSSRFSELVSIFEKMQMEIENNLENLVQLNEARLVRLWKETLSAMLNREVELDQDTAHIVLEGILKRISDKNSLLIYLAPLDLENIRSQADRMTESLRGVKHLELIADPRVERGSCIVETNLGIYDARWRVQMEQIEMQIADLYREVIKESIEPIQDKGKRKRKKKDAEKGSSEE